MKVSELIEELKKMPQDAEVVHPPRGELYGYYSGIDIVFEENEEVVIE